MFEQKKKKSIKKGIVITIGVIAVIVAAVLIAPQFISKSIPYEEAKVETETITTYSSFTGNVESKNPNSKKIKIKVKVDEYDIMSIKKDKKVAVTINAIEKTVAGKISSISNKAELSMPGSGQSQSDLVYFTAVITIPKDSDVKIGMSAEAKVIKNKVVDVVAIPIDYLQFDEKDKPYVLIKSRDNEKNKSDRKKQYLELGTNDGLYVEVVKGLKTGQTIFGEKNIENTQSSTSGFVPPMQ
ncbi:MAG: HlyD family efflux transporter periplasmic adaptor subunit [Anaerovoracaceae bacterium]